MSCPYLMWRYEHDVDGVVAVESKVTSMVVTGIATSPLLVLSTGSAITMMLTKCKLQVESQQ
jgi:hypothetical protein